ncbi:10196_t:CDS:2, partial [Paraglomus occultum]
MKRHQPFEFIMHDPSNKTKRRVTQSNSSNRHGVTSQTDLPNSEINNFGSQIMDSENANDINADGDNANDVDVDSTIDTGGNHNNTLPEFKRSKNWQREETLTLIGIMKSYYKSLNTAKSPVQKGKVWQSICDEFSTICPDTWRSDKAIRKRWDKLLEDYKRVQDNNRKTGAERMEFEYEEEIRDVVIDDPVFNEVYDSENRRDMIERRVRRRETRNDGIELIRELHEENREENRVYRD